MAAFKENYDTTPHLTTQLGPELKQDVVEYCKKRHINASSLTRDFWIDFLDKQGELKYYKKSA